MQLFSDLFSNVLNFTWQQGLMILIGCLLIFLAARGAGSAQNLLQKNMA